jgi:hypothetical protein
MLRIYLNRNIWFSTNIFSAIEENVKEVVHSDDQVARTLSDLLIFVSGDKLDRELFEQNDPRVENFIVKSK